MLKFEKVAEVGSTIRAYDFKPMLGREDCFVEGKVLAKGDVGCGYKAFKIVVTKDVFGGEVLKKGKESRLGREVFVPFEVSFMEYDARIIDLTSL
jgi:hypothetical protein